MKQDAVGDGRLRPDVATWQTGRRVVLDSGPFASLLCEKTTSFTKPDIYNILSEEDRATATGNMYRKSSEIWTCVFSYMRPDRQTDN